MVYMLSARVKRSRQRALVGRVFGAIVAPGFVLRIRYTPTVAANAFTRYRGYYSYKYIRPTYKVN